MSVILEIGLILRVIVILLGFVAMWSLWIARRERKKIWTSKMKDIWLCHFLLIAASVESNIEHLYRHSMPPIAIFLFAFVFIWTVKGTFNGDFYTKEDK